MPLEIGLADDLVFREELRDFPDCRLRRIRSMHRVFADRFCVRLANGPGGGLSGVGRAHDLAVFRDSIVAFQYLHHDRPGYHEIDELAEERPLAMHCVEFLRLLTGNAQPLLRDNAQTRLLDDRVDGTCQIALQSRRV